MDPGEFCGVLGLGDRVLDCEIYSALSQRDREKAAALTTVAYSLSPFRHLYKVPQGGQGCPKWKKETQVKRTPQGLVLSKIARASELLG